MLKMFADSLFTGLQGTGKREWKRFERALKDRLDQLRRSVVSENGVIEETHHVGLACELIQACLQQRLEDRWVCTMTFLLRKNSCMPPVVEIF